MAKRPITPLTRNTNGTASYAYNRSSLPTQTCYPNRSVGPTTYDLAKRVSSVQNAQGASIVSSYQPST
jgi:hypothetical protein